MIHYIRATALSLIVAPALLGYSVQDYYFMYAVAIILIGVSLIIDER